MDGLSAVVPYGDPGLAGLRGELVPPAPGQDGRAARPRRLLRPASVADAICTRMYQANELLPVHAVAGPYRVRSHFEAQDYLESGADHRMTSGWLNRAVAAMPPPRLAGPRATRWPSAYRVPLLLRGPAQVGSWAPHGFAAAGTGSLRAHRRAQPATTGSSARPSPRGCASAASATRCMAGERAPETSRYAFSALAHGGRRDAGAPRTARASRRWRSAAGTPIWRRPTGWRACCASSTPGWWR